VVVGPAWTRAGSWTPLRPRRHPPGPQAANLHQRPTPTPTQGLVLRRRLPALADRPPCPTEFDPAAPAARAAAQLCPRRPRFPAREAARAHQHRRRAAAASVDGQAWRQRRSKAQQLQVCQMDLLLQLPFCSPLATTLQLTAGSFALHQLQLPCRLPVSPGRRQVRKRLCAAPGVYGERRAGGLRRITSRRLRGQGINALCMTLPLCRLWLRDPCPVLLAKLLPQRWTYRLLAGLRDGFALGQGLLVALAELELKSQARVHGAEADLGVCIMRCG
jgi:hypothetical protein